MLNITRIYNSTTAVGNMRRMLALVRDYADRRTVSILIIIKKFFKTKEKYII
jgi:alkylation response protein AidB-like acyl-CoA dehydrogenase